jgi:hypothetical protein
MKRRFLLDVLLIALIPLVDSINIAVAHAAGTGNGERLVDIGGGRKMYLNW